MNRSRDPERITLEALAALHDINDNGQIRAVSELKFCNRCLDAFADFDAIYGDKIMVHRISTSIESRPRQK